MSEEMFFEVPVNDTKTVYTVGDWKEYAIRDDHNINDSNANEWDARIMVEKY